jgi:protoporphyrinogen/coproporphyrinogen III oxidase
MSRTPSREDEVGGEPLGPEPGSGIRDVVIVGAGLAGLTAAAGLRGRDVLLLEAEDRVGGRIRSEYRGPYWLNEGAHLFGGAQTPVGELIDRYELDARPVNGSLTAVAMDGRLIEEGTPMALLTRLPLSLAARTAMLRSGVRILRHTRAYRSFASPRAGEGPADMNRRLLGFMNDRSFAQLLGPLPSSVDSLYRAISNRAQASPEELAAGAALSAFALVFAKDNMLGRCIVGGAGRLIDALARDHDATLVTNARVSSVDARDGGVEVQYRTPRGTEIVRARCAVVATPSDVAAAIIRGLPEDTAQALAAIRSGPSVVMALLTDERSSMPWDGIYSGVVAGKSFNMFFNQASVLRSRDGARLPGGSLMIYASGDLGRGLLDASDEEIRRRFLSDLRDVFPETRGIIREAVVRRWRYGTAYAHVGRAALQPALERPLGRIVLAGDYLGAWFTDSAVLTAKDAVRRTEVLLGERACSGASDRRP